MHIVVKRNDGKRPRDIAENVVCMAENGDKWTIQFLAERLDGKPEVKVDIVQETSVARFLARLGTPQHGCLELQAGPEETHKDS